MEIKQKRESTLHIAVLLLHCVMGCISVVKILNAQQRNIISFPTTTQTTAVQFIYTPYHSERVNKLKSRIFK